MGKSCTKNRTHTWADLRASPSFTEDLSTAEKLVWAQGRLLRYTGTQKTFNGIVAVAPLGSLSDIDTHPFQTMETNLCIIQGAIPSCMHNTQSQAGRKRL